jgi:hypothetical protein
MGEPSGKEFYETGPYDIPLEAPPNIETRQLYAHISKLSPPNPIVCV